MSDFEKRVYIAPYGRILHYFAYIVVLSVIHATQGQWIEMYFAGQWNK